MITLRQNSTSPNIGNSNLVHAVTSNSSSEAQYRFVADINDASGTLLQRVKQQPNPNATGIFDFGNIVPTYLGPTDTVWDISVATANTACGKDIQFRFGEEYATSTTGSVTLYVGDDTAAGNPRVSGSDYVFLLDGVTNPNDLVSWNWNSGSKYDEEDTYGTPTFNHQNGLTAFDTQSIREGDYATISILNGNLLGITGSAVDNGFAQDVYAMKVVQYDSSDSVLDTNTFYNVNTGLRTSSTDLWDDVYLDQTENTRLVHWPVGYQNLTDAGVLWDQALSYYVVTFHNQTAEPGVNDAGIWGTYRFNIDTANCDYPGVRFAWKNEYGVWDYFNMTLAESTTSAIERESYEQSFVNYSSANTSTYDTSRRGESQFQNRVSKTRTAQSDYLTQENADNLRELFFSTNVYVQEGTTFLPVVITNASVTEKTNPRSQKLFTYTVEYKYANNERPRV